MFNYATYFSMNVQVNWLLVAVTLGLLSLGSQAVSYESAPGAESSPPASSTPAPTQILESGMNGEEIFLPSAAVLLPVLSDAEIEALQAELTQGIDTWFGLAGLSKLPAPPPLSDALHNYRNAWSTVNVDVATFLGSWHDGEGYPYSVSIFPSSAPGQVCVLEFKPEWSLYIFNEATGEYGKDMISEQILTFSVATVEDGHLRSSQVRSVGSATAVANYAVGEAYPVMFMSLMDGHGSRRVVALSSPPTLPSDLPTALVAPVSQALYDYGCTTALAPPDGNGNLVPNR